MNLNVSNDLEELSRRVAGWVTNYVNETLTKQERFTLALSGGNTPKKLYQLLSSENYKNSIDWSKLHIFWGDERYVPFTDDRNNAKMAFESLLNHVPVPREQIHMMRTDIEPEASADAYEKILHEYFTHRRHSFDLVLLGMGDNAHTLSLFPGYDIIHEKERWVKAFYLEEQKSYRISLTVPVVNKSARVAFLVSGGDKAASLYNVLYGEHDPGLYPAQIIQPYSDELYWFADAAAAADIAP
ncbi:MAG: 6-phosphogluconolactonase, eukaryotic type [Chitinophagaceae bacterium]|nr:6-phosphogluconolactonase, eukaryotic type [Chitinophagaceae bacterium]